jgi:predicted Zn-dependent peptidase
VLPEDTELACDIIADMLQHSIFRVKELDREKQVIIQEIGRDLDSPEDTIYDLMHQLAFPKQKIGRPILGSSKVIERLPRSAVIDYVRRYYHAANMIIVAAGKVDHHDFVNVVTKRFAKLPKGKPPKSEKTHISSGVKLAPKEIEQLHLILGFAGPGFHTNEIYAVQLLSILLGGSASSRLFQKVREKRGLVYTINSGHIAFSDSGIFQIYAGTDPERVGELVPVVCSELRDVTHKISDEELARAKAQGRADMLMGKENIMRRADILGHQLLAFNRTIPTEEILQRLMMVTKKDVQATAAKLIKRRPILTALGPLDNLEDYRKVAQRLAG